MATDACVSIRMLRYQHVIDGQEADRPFRQRTRTSRTPLTGTFVVETMGLEPTTPCLQSGIRAGSDLGRNDKSAGQRPFRLTGMTAG